MVIRPYQPCDREMVRRICCETADLGEPVERFFPDREVFADLITRYYTDYEPSSTWVAETDGRVVGYLTGCLDTRRYCRMMGWRVAARAAMKGVRRGALVSRQAWRLWWAALRTVVIGGFNRRIPLEAYPAHLHLNIQREFRGQRVGSQLAERFIEQAKSAKLSGIHVSISADNAPSRNFFERFGFSVLSRHPLIRLDGDGSRLTATIVYGKAL